MKSIEEILKTNGLKLTKARVQVLDLFKSTDFALSFSDIEGKIDASIDKVTVYRTLSTFEEKGLIHQVIDDGAVIKYASCKNKTCEGGHHHDTHVHFKCAKCGKTYCLENTNIPEISFPKGFTPKQFSVLVQGFCEACS